MLIDTNTCFGTTPTRRVAYADVVTGARMFDEPGPADPTFQDVDWSLENLMRIVDRHHVARALTYSLRGKLYDAAAGNEETWQAARQHDRLVPVATLDPRRDLRWREEIDRCLDRGFRIFRFFPDAQGWTISALPFVRIAEALSAHDVTVMLPAGGWGQQTAMARMLCPMGLTVVATGATFGVVAESIQVAAEHTGFFCETSAMCTGGMIETVARRAGAHTLVFGSRSPEFSFEAPYNLVAAADISQTDRDRILGLNAAEHLLGGQQGR
ncbi:MAG: amidohydrolase family protein [Armatimonadota bacterium]